MGSINHVILVGNATRDTELKATKTGKPISNIRLATNRLVSGKEQTQFHSIICWDTLAEVTGKHATKGRLLGVVGRLEYRKFTDKEGREREVAEIIAQDVRFLDAKGSAAPVDDAADVNPDDVPL